MEQLSRYENLFKPSQLLILKSEELFLHTEKIWQKIQSFLEIRPIPLSQSLPKANAGLGESENVNPSIRFWLRNELSPTVKSVKMHYGFDWNW